MGLCWILRGLKRQQQLTDRRSRWLKDKYLQLYYEENNSSPITADAIRVFGGRDWSALTESAGTLSPTSSSTLRRRNVKGKKTKSIGNIHILTKVRTQTRLEFFPATLSAEKWINLIELLWQSEPKFCDPTFKLNTKICINLFWDSSVFMCIKCIFRSHFFSEYTDIKKLRSISIRKRTNHTRFGRRKRSFLWTKFKSEN